MAIVAIEGIDGSGKDTLIKYIVNNLDYRIKPYVYTSCTDSLLGRHIRRKLKEENTDDLLLSTAFICETITASDCIRRMLRNNTEDNLILLNRWVYSTLAYGCDDDDEVDYFVNMKNHILIPDMVIYLDLPINIAIERICKRTHKDFEKYENSDVLSKVKDKYDKVFSGRLCFNNNTKFVKVDSSRNNYKEFALSMIKTLFDRPF